VTAQARLAALPRAPCENGGVLDHVGMQCTDLVASAAFYDVVLEPLGGRRLMDFGSAIGYGAPPHADFWISAQETGDGFRESHVAFTAPSRAAVRAFFDVAVAEGATVLHAPRLWPEYHETYFGAFVRDPDGNNIEAVCHLPELPVRPAGRAGARQGQGM
jgi:catechol 2,3-dioxygenase-like lactoylglutathione lyase family enzyme